MIKQANIVDDGVEEDDEDTESDKEKEGSGSENELVEDERIEKERSHITKVISLL